MSSNRKDFKWIPYIALAAIALVCVVLLGLFGHNNALFAAGGSSRATTDFRETDRVVSFDSASGPVFHAHSSDGYAFITRDMISFIDTSGATAWQHLLTLDSAQLYTNQERFIVYEPRGNTAYVFSTSGMMYHRTFDGQILSASINSSGASAFIIKTGNTYQTYLFDPEGLRPTRQIYHNDEFMFPVSATISEDGQIAAVALIDTGGVNIRSRLTFYFQNEHAQLHGDGLFARLQYDDEIIGKLTFFSDGSLAAFSDRAIRRINFSHEIVNETSVLTLGNRISSIVRTGGNGFAIALGDGFIGTDSERAGTVIAFDSSLQERFRFLPDRNTTYLWANDSAVIVGAGRNIYGLAIRDGRLLWNYHATQDYTQVLMLENRDTILFVARNEARVKRRGR